MKNTAKKLILSTLATATALFSYAQRNGLWITPHAAIGAGTMTDTYPLEWSPKASVVFSFGADATYMFNNHIGVATGITYAGYGFLWEQRNLLNREDIQAQAAQATLDVPVYFRAVTGSGGGFFAHVGFINHFLIAATEEVKVNGTTIERYEGSDAKSDFAGWTFSPFVYFGGNIRCGNKVQMTVGPQIAYQVPTNFSSDSGVDGHYITFALKIGVGIHTVRTK